jgi:uncharacterized protein
MQLSESRDIAAARETVWAAVLDPEVLKACIPGCQELTGSVDDGFEATVVQKVGPVKATFRGAVTLSDIVPGEGCVLSGEGKGGPAGFAKGSARLRLTDIPGGTRLGYDVEAHVGGKLAQLGSRLIDGFARKLADDFFARFQKSVEGGDESAVGAETASGAVTEGGPDDGSAAPQGGDEKARKGWLRRLTTG